MRHEGRVIFHDQLGCGRSDRPGDLSLWNVDRFVEELAQVRSALNLASHLCFAERPEEFNTVINSFMT